MMMEIAGLLHKLFYILLALCSRERNLMLCTSPQKKQEDPVVPYSQIYLEACNTFSGSKLFLYLTELFVALDFANFALG